MKRSIIILFALLTLAACEKERGQSTYSVQRIASRIEVNADGTGQRVETYKYNDTGYSISTTVDGALTDVVTYVYETKFIHRIDSTVVDGTLTFKSKTTTTYEDDARSKITGVTTVDADGVELSRSEYEYDGNAYSITTYDKGVASSKKIITTLYNIIAEEHFLYNAEEAKWIYDSKDVYTYSDYLRNTLLSCETYDSSGEVVQSDIYSYDQYTTMCITYIGDVASTKSVYVSSSMKIEFQNYKSVGDSWKLTSYGSYNYELVTFTN